MVGVALTNFKDPVYKDYDFEAVLEQVEEKYGELLQEFKDQILKAGGPVGSYGNGRGNIVPIEEKAKYIVGHLMLGNSVEEACNKSRISFNTLKNYRKQYKPLNEVVKGAMEDGFAVFEEEARRRAIDGVSSYVTSGGRIVMDKDGRPLIEQKYSDTVLMFLMRGKRPDVYGQRTDVNFSGSINIAGSRDAFLSRLAPLFEILLSDDELDQEEGLPALIENVPRED